MKIAICFDFKFSNLQEKKNTKKKKKNFFCFLIFNNNVKFSNLEKEKINFELIRMFKESIDDFCFSIAKELLKKKKERKQ